MKSAINFLVLFVLFLFSISGFAQDNCLDESEVKYLSKKFEFNVTGKSSFHRCQKDSHSYKLLESLIFLKSLRFSIKELLQPFNQKILENGFWDYFVSFEPSFHDVGATDSACVNGFIAFVRGSSEPGPIYLCPSVYDSDLSTMERVDMFLHEVRHFEFHPHFKCTRGAFKGIEGGCDNRIEDKGSYAVSVEALARMALMGENLSPVQIEQAREGVLFRAENHFNKPVVPDDFSIIYLNDEKTGKAYLFNGKKLINVSFVQQGVVISRDTNLIVFPPDKADAYAVDLYSKNLASLPVSGTTSITYNKTERQNRPEIVDIMNTPELKCTIFRREFDCHLGDQEYRGTVDWNLQSMSTPAEWGEKNKKGIYLKNEAGALFFVQFLSGNKTKIMPIDKPEMTSFRKIILFQKKTLALTESGEMLQKVIEKKTIKWIPYKPLAGKFFTTMTRPVQWIEQLAEKY